MRHKKREIQEITANHTPNSQPGSKFLLQNPKCIIISVVCVKKILQNYASMVIKCNDHVLD